MRQHGPQLMRLYAHKFSWPILVALSRKMWLRTSVSMALNWCDSMHISFRGRYLWHFQWKCDCEYALAWPPIDVGCSSIPSFFVEKKALEADTCGTLSENVIANMRQHGPQLMRLYAHKFSWPILVALSRKMWLRISVSMAPNWCDSMHISFRGRYLWHS